MLRQHAVELRLQADGQRRVTHHVLHAALPHDGRDRSDGARVLVALAELAILLAREFVNELFCAFERQKPQLLELEEIFVGEQRAQLGQQWRQVLAVATNGERERPIWHIGVQACRCH